MKICI